MTDTADLRIAVILGSTRPGRNGEAVAKWVLEQTAGRDAQYDLIDLADHRLPLLEETKPPSFGQYQGEHTKKWAQTIAKYDGFIMVTPEYNHSTSGVLKNALDHIYAEWNDKAVAFVGYGVLGAARAIEHLRGIAGELQLADVRAQLSFLFSADFENYSVFQPSERQADAAQMMFGQLERWALALRALRIPQDEEPESWRVPGI